jgi:hypothetical protein
MKKCYTHLLLLVILGFSFSGCEKEKTNSDPIQVGNVLINSNQQELNSRVSLSDNLLLVEDDDLSRTKGTKEAPKVDLTKNYVFRLKAEVDPPVYKGSTLQATHVKIYDKYAFVTYNTKGNTYLGGIDVFNVSDIEHPVIIWQALFSNADVSSVDYFNDKLYIVGAIDLDSKDKPEHLTHPSMLQVISLNADKSFAKTDTIIDLGSYVGTDVRVTENNIFTTSGSNGFLKVFNHSYGTVTSTSLTDARAIEANTQNIFVLQGDPGQVNVYNRANGSFVKTIGVSENALQSEAKSEIAVSDKYIFAALNSEGMKMLNLDGSLKQLFPKPVTPEGKLDQNYVTNSVSLNEDLVLFANGEAGLYLGGIVSSRNDSLAILGRIHFGEGQSVNFVESKDSIIFVATGTGGLKILSIGIDNGVPPDIIKTKPCSTLYSRIIELFPEGWNNKSRYPALFANNTLKVIKLTKETEVFVTFVEEEAGWKNSFGYYIYNEANPPQSVEGLQKSILFQNVSQIDEGGGLQTGDMLKVGNGKFPAGTVIGFYLVAQGWKNGNLVNGLYTHYTDTYLNTNSNQQHVLFKEKNCGDIVMAFEDISLTLGTSDNDFNDILFTISDSSNPDKVTDSFDLTTVPEF